VTLCVDGSDVAKGRIPRLLAMLSSTGMDIGRAIAPVNRDYAPPFAYGGRIDKVTFELAARREAGDAKDEAEREARAAMARQ
jgi:arylsulfatase